MSSPSIRPTLTLLPALPNAQTGRQTKHEFSDKLEENAELFGDKRGKERQSLEPGGRAEIKMPRGRTMAGFTEQGTVGVLQPLGRLAPHRIAVDPAEASLQSDKAKILKSKEYTRFCGCKINFKRVYFSFR